MAVAFHRVRVYESARRGITERRQGPLPIAMAPAAASPQARRDSRRHPLVRRDRRGRTDLRLPGRIDSPEHRTPAVLRRRDDAVGRRLIEARLLKLGNLLSISEDCYIKD